MGPELRATEAELRARGSLVPKYLILQLVGLGVIVNNKTFKILRALIHNLTKGVKIGKHSGILLIELPAIADNIFTQNKDIVDISS
jgi:hypothetical protein